MTRSSSGFGPGLVLVAVMGLGAPTASVSAQTAADEGPSTPEWMILIDASVTHAIRTRVARTTSPAPRERNDLARDLSSLAAGNLASLCAVIWDLDAIDDGSASPEADRPTAPENPRSWWQQRALQKAITAHRGAALRKLLAQVGAAPESTLVDRIRVLQLLRIIGHAKELELALEILGGVNAAEMLIPQLGSIAHDTVIAIAHRDPNAYDTLRGRWRGLPIHVRASIVSALGEAFSPDALELLENALGDEPEVAVRVHCALVRLAQVRPLDLQRSTLRKLHAHLRHGPALLRQRAARTALVIRDVGSIPGLIRMLDHEDRCVVRSGVDALRGLSGQLLGTDGNLWKHWFEAELTWRETLGEQARIHLASDDPQQVVQGLRAVSAHTTFAAEFLDDLRPLLQSPHAGIRCAVCATIGGFGIQEGLQDFATLLESDPDPAVRDAALQALVALTGRDLGPDPEGWNRLILWRQHRSQPR